MKPADAAARAHKRLLRLEEHARAAGTVPARERAPDELAGAVAARLRYHLAAGLPLTFAWAERAAADCLSLMLAVDAAELVDVAAGDEAA